jgi:ribA/ribD-fused uncharacterized protein
MLFNHNPEMEEAIKFSRFDKESPFATISDHPFLLEDQQWKTPEHYYQANKFKGLSYAQKIIAAEDGQQAYNLGNRWLKRKVSDWKKNRQLFMTRALFRKVMEYPDIQQALLDTGDSLMIETSSYDYFWGVGRDLRGQNMLGKVWMDIRKKIITQNASG